MIPFPFVVPSGEDAAKAWSNVLESSMGFVPGSSLTTDADAQGVQKLTQEVVDGRALDNTFADEIVSAAGNQFSKVEAELMRGAAAAVGSRNNPADTEYGRELMNAMADMIERGLKTKTSTRVTQMKVFNPWLPGLPQASYVSNTGDSNQVLTTGARGVAQARALSEDRVQDLLGTYPTVVSLPGQEEPGHVGRRMGSLEKVYPYHWVETLIKEVGDDFKAGRLERPAIDELKSRIDAHLAG